MHGGCPRPQPDGGYAELPYDDGRDCRERDFPPDHSAGEIQDGGCDECNHGGAHSLEGGIHVTVLADVREIDGYEQDDDERREYHARHGREGAPVAGYLVADEYGRVEGYRAGSRLGQRKQFEKVTACYPAAPVYHLPFDEGYHGEASSEGESTYFEKGREEREAYPQAACTLRLYVAYVP